MRRYEKDILRLYKALYRGKENAITRAEFKLKHFWRFQFHPLSDREFRNIYSQLPIATCEKGGYWPVRPEEILEYRNYLRKKAIPLFERFRMVCDAHPDLADDNTIQLELF